MRRLRKAIKLIDREELWEKIEDWFDAYGWNHCYVTFDGEGRLFHVQSSGRDYCQGAHYISSGHYDWYGRTKLRWSFENKRGHVYFPNGRIARRRSCFLAVILFRTKLEYSRKKKGYTHIWNGDTPELWFKRTRASHRLYEKTNGKRFFIRGKFTTEEKGIPPIFLEEAKIAFRELIQYINRLKRVET